MDTNTTVRLPTKSTDPAEDPIIDRFPPLLSTPASIDPSLSRASHGVYSLLQRRKRRNTEGRREDDSKGPLFPPLDADSVTVGGKRKWGLPIVSATSSTPLKKQKWIPDPKRTQDKTAKVANDPHQTKDAPNEDEPNEEEEVDAGVTRGKPMNESTIARKTIRKPDSWTDQEVNLLLKLNKEGKTLAQISLELLKTLGSVRTKYAVKNKLKKKTTHEKEWSSEDARILLQVIENFDRDRAITDKFNRLTGKCVAKWFIQVKLRGLELAGKKTGKN